MSKNRPRKTVYTGKPEIDCNDPKFREAHPDQCKTASAQKAESVNNESLPFLKRSFRFKRLKGWLLLVLLIAGIIASTLLLLWGYGVLGSLVSVARPKQGIGYAKIIYLDGVTGNQTPGAQVMIYGFDNETFVETIEQNTTHYFSADSVAVAFVPASVGQLYVNATIAIEASDSPTNPKVNYITLARKTPTSNVVARFYGISNTFPDGQNASNLVADREYLIRLHMNNTLWSSNESKWGVGYILPNSTFAPGYQTDRQVYRHGGWIAFDQNVTFNISPDAPDWGDSWNVTASLWVIPWMNMPIDETQVVLLNIRTTAVAPVHVWIYQGSVADYAEKIEITS